MAIIAGHNANELMTTTRVKLQSSSMANTSDQHCNRMLLRDTNDLTAKLIKHGKTANIMNKFIIKSGDT